MGATVIPIWREGILSINKVPRYIVRQTDFPGGESVVGVYKVSERDYKASKGKVINKDWETKQEPSHFSGDTLLAGIAKSKETRKNIKVEKPALYTSRVQNGIGTFGGKEGLGFFEYEPEEYSAIQHKYLPSKPTGVFILLDDIKWTTDTNMDEKALIRLLTATDNPSQHMEGLYRFDK